MSNMEKCAQNLPTDNQVKTALFASDKDSTMKRLHKDDRLVADLRSQIPDVDNIFNIHRRIGEGTFSNVFLASLKCHENVSASKRKLFAVKHLIPTSHPQRIEKELKCLLEIGGIDNVVGVDLCLRRNDAVAFVMPYVPHDRFHDYFDKMTARELQSYMRNICIALKRVHSFGIIHRDVKPSNFLHDRKNQKYLLVDFGLAQNVNNNLVVTTNNSNNNNINVDKNSTKLPIEATTATVANNDADAAAAADVGKNKRKASAIDNDNEEKTDDCNSSSNIIDNNVVTNSSKRPRYNNSSLSFKSHQQQNSAIANNTAAVDVNILSETTATAAVVTADKPSNGIDNDENALPSSTINNNNNNNNTTTIPSPFKQPLKQSNENVATLMTPKNISMGTTTDTANDVSTAVNKSKQSSFDSPLTRHIKSAVLGYIMNAKIEKQRNQIRGPVNGIINNTTVTNKYNNQNTNPQIAGSKQSQQQQHINNNNNNNSTTGGVSNNNSGTTTKTTAMCCCYGKPTVCNICIVKKEIHATRAGTPGYRPPEVLLKYPNQTTAVDMWAIGVIMITILSNCYPFFKGADDFSALAEMITVFGDDAIKKTARLLARHVCVSRRKQPLHLRKLCIRLRNGNNGVKPSPDNKNSNISGGGGGGGAGQTATTTCDNCQQIPIMCLCANSIQNIDFSNDIYPASAYDLMAKLLAIDPSNRISAAMALEHPFFREELL